MTKYTRHQTKCLLGLNEHCHNINVIVDDGTLYDRTVNIVANQPNHMDSGNGLYDGFFMVDDNLFMIVDCDRPVKHHVTWVPHYQNQGVKAYFIDHDRRSTRFIFKDCPIPVIHFCCVIHHSAMPTNYYNTIGHEESMNTEKDISVFFSGKCSHRRIRGRYAKVIGRSIPNCSIKDTSYKYGPTDHLLSNSMEYINKLKRSKIAWCPRTVFSQPDPECNSVTIREFEAMALEVLVAKSINGVVEPEPRIPGVHYVDFNNGNTDLLDVLNYYLEHEDERKSIAHNGYLWWKRNASELARAKNFMSRSLEVIYGSGNYQEL